MTPPTDFAHPVAVTVIHDLNLSTVPVDQPVFKVIGINIAGGGVRGVAVIVISKADHGFGEHGVGSFTEQPVHGVIGIGFNLGLGQGPLDAPAPVVVCITGSMVVGVDLLYLVVRLVIGITRHPTDRVGNGNQASQFVISKEGGDIGLIRLGNPATQGVIGRAIGGGVGKDCLDSTVEFVVYRLGGIRPGVGHGDQVPILVINKERNLTQGIGGMRAAIGSIVGKEGAVAAGVDHLDHPPGGIIDRLLFSPIRMYCSSETIQRIILKHGDEAQLVGLGDLTAFGIISRGNDTAIREASLYQLTPIVVEHFGTAEEFVATGGFQACLIILGFGKGPVWVDHTDESVFVVVDVAGDHGSPRRWEWCES